MGKDVVEFRQRDVYYWGEYGDSMSANHYDATLSDLIANLRYQKEKNRKACLLIGAGCSVTAGIPTASEFVRLIQEKFPYEFGKAENDSYFACMEQLNEQQRSDLIDPYINGAKINVTHLLIAHLMREGFVDHVLTTNFDNLLMRAHGLMGSSPAVYDIASTKVYHKWRIPEKAIFHLHGQHTGFLVLHTKKQMNALKKKIGTLIKDIAEDKLFIIVGYNGNDPVLDKIAEIITYPCRVYWIGYDKGPGKVFSEKLLAKKRNDIRFIGGFDSDDFFRKLITGLDIPLPLLMEKPIHHVKGLLASIAAMRSSGPDKSELDLLEKPKVMLDKIIAAIDNNGNVNFDKNELQEDEFTSMIERLYWSYKEDIIIVLYEDNPSRFYNEELKNRVYWSYVVMGNKYGNPCLESGEPNPTLSREKAYEYYKGAMVMNPKGYEALNNWGFVLSDQAKTKTGDEADILFVQAAKKYERALAIKPDYHEAFSNWGFVLSNQAKMKTGDEADVLFANAADKYRQALAIKPDKHVALYNWSSALLGQWRNRGDLSDFTLVREALEKALHAENIKPGAGTYNIACAYSIMGNEKRAKKWLYKAFEYGVLPSIDHLNNDPDMDNVREKEWFKELLGKNEEKGG